MSAPSLDRYAVHFDRLSALPPSEREAALAELSLDDDERALLRRLLEADAEDDTDPLARALGDAASAELASLAPRDRLGAYRLVRELGSGGMGTVFLAERIDGGFTQQVAIKLLRGFPTSEGLRRLRQERQILAGLDHPNIARLIDGGESADGQPWLALEHVDGLPLLDYCARHAPRLRQRLALFDAILGAVGHAHQRLVIHRDIKPSNVLVDAQGRAKLLDFGIARLVDLEEDVVAQTSTRVYSAGYASPEQRDGRAITTASDIYSLGMLLAELVPGTRPDADLAGIIARATDADPARRYASAGEFRDDLDRYRAGRPVRAARLTRLYRLRKFVNRHRLGVAAALVAVLGCSLFVWRLDHERDRAVAAEVAAARDAQRARAALGFLTDAFEAAAPDHALSQTVSVRELLDKATATIDGAEYEPVVASSIQRMLGRLYDSLGEHDAALERFRLGLADVVPEDREQALEIAWDLDQYANLLGIVDRSDEAREAVDQARQLRERFAPDDAIEQARSTFSLAVWHRNAGEGAKSVPLFRQVLGSPGTSLPVDLEVRAAAFLAGALLGAGACAESIEIADRGLRRLAGGDAASSQQLWLRRTRASSLRACGRPAEAETELRDLISIQSRIVGEGGMGMLQLANELSRALTAQGRYREASTLMQEVRIPEGIGPYNRAVLLVNVATMLDDAGDYARALELASQAGAVMDEAGIESDNDGRRTIARVEARLRGLAGQHAKAIDALEDLRERARRIDGENSAEYANATWQLAFAMRRAGQAESAPLLDEAERVWHRLLPSPHRVFALVHRARAGLALAEGRTDDAERELTAALAMLEEASAPPTDTAAAWSELAGVRLRQGRMDEARDLLHKALPGLREAFHPEQVERADAERLALALGLS